MLPDRLKDETCTLAAQDDSFFAYYFTDPAFAARFEQKFGFAQVPWGMGVARDRQRQAGPRARPDEPDLSPRRRVPRDRPRQSHRHRLSRAAAGRLAAARLQHRQRQHQPRLRPAGRSMPSWSRRRSPASVAAFEDWYRDATGIDLAAADAEDRAGLVAVPERRRQFADPDRRRAGGDLGLRAGCSARRWARASGCCAGRRARVTVALQSSPIVLTLVIAAALAHAICSLFVGGGARRRDPGARPHQRQQCRPGDLRGDAEPARRTGRPRCRSAIEPVPARSAARRPRSWRF